MTSRECLALAVLAAPAVGVALVAVAPRARSRSRGRRRGSRLDRGGRRRARGRRARRPGHRQLGRWIVVDPAGGLLVGVIGIVGLASALVSPQLPARAAERRCSATDRADRVYCVLLCSPSGRSCSPFRWPATSASPGSRSRRRPPHRRCSSASAAAPRALEAGWKYLILTSLGLGDRPARDPRPRRRRQAAAGSRRSPGGRSPQSALDPDPALVAYVLLLAGLAAKIGWAPVHNWLPDAHSEAPAAGLGAALCRAAAGGAARRVALAAGARPDARRPDGAAACSSPSASSRSPSRCRSCGGRMAWKRLLAYSSLEHMGVIALGIGFGGAARARRRRGPHRRARAREGARLLRGDAAARARAARRRPRGHRNRRGPSRRSARRSASRSARSPGCRPPRSSSARC